MNLFKMTLATATTVLLIVTAAGAQEREIDQGAPLLRSKVLVTAHELANPALYYPGVSERYVPPNAVYGAPPTPASIVRPGNFDQHDSTIITVLNASGVWGPMWRDMIEIYVNGGHTWIIANSSDQDIKMIK